LQHDRGRGRIESGPAFPPIPLSECESRFGFAARQSLVLQIDRQAGSRSQLRDERSNARRLIAVEAVKPSRQTYDNPIDGVFTSEIVNRLQDERDRVFVRPSPIDRSKGARQDAGRIADGEADAALAEIDPQHAHAAS